MRLPALLLAMALVTYLPRLLPLLALSGRRMPPLVVRFLEGIPVAVLAAFVAPLILAPEGRLDVGLHNPQLLAAVPTIVVSLLSRNLLVTVLGGAVFMVLARALL